MLTRMIFIFGPKFTQPNHQELIPQRLCLKIRKQTIIPQTLDMLLRRSPKFWHSGKTIFHFPDLLLGNFLYKIITMAEK